jgi:hypothetical protein
MLHLRPPPAAAVIAFPNTQAESVGAVTAQLQNILVALTHRHGDIAARLMLAEAAIQVVAHAARQANALVATRFAFEVETDRAFQRQPLPGGFDDNGNIVA